MFGRTPLTDAAGDSSESMPASEAVELLVDAEVNNGFSPDMEARKRLFLALSSSCLRSLTEGSSRYLFSRSASAVASLLPVGAPPFFILATAQQLGVSIASATAHTGTSQRKGTVQVPSRVSKHIRRQSACRQSACRQSACSTCRENIRR
jgi:hypothetical protein